MTTTKKLREHVHVGRFQVVWPGKEVHDRWMALARETMVATNWLWQNWEAWHVQHETANAIRKMLREHDEWKQKKRKRRPKPVYAVTKELSSHLYYGLADIAPSLHSATRGALQHRWEHDLTTRKATHGNLKLWINILLCRDRRPGTTDPQPIPIKKIKTGTKAFELLPPDRFLEPGCDGDWKARLRLDRYDEHGKVQSHVDEVTIVTRTRKMRSHKVILDRLATGEWAFCSSALQYDSRRNKWELLLYHKRPQYDAEVSPENRAVVRAGHRGPWRIKRSGGKSHPIGGTGMHVDWMFRNISRQRRRVILQRQSRKENYRWSTSARKGRGDKRAVRNLAPLQEKWNDTVKTTNQTTCCRIIQYCLQHQIGRLVYVQSVESSRARKRWLDVCGKTEQMRDRSSWAWYQLGDMLQRKGEQYGIEVVVVKQKTGREMGGSAEPPMVSVGTGG